MKLLVINTVGLRREGITSTMLDFYGTMEKHDLQIELVATGKVDLDIVERFQGMGCKVTTLPSRKENPIRYFIELMNLIRKRKFDIVHAHGNSATLAIEMLAAKFGKCKVRIAHSRNTKCTQIKMDKVLRTLFYRTYTDGFACGIEAGKWLFGEREFKVIHNGKKLEKFKYDEETRLEYRNSLGIKDELCIGHVGNINFQKNHKFLIDVFSEVIKVNKDAKLFLMGDGPLRKEIEQQVKRLGLVNRVVILGQCDCVPQMLQAMDVMVLPSLFEGLPNVVIEWQAAGLPCIISDSITKECIVTSLVQQLPLNIGANKWAKAILETKLSDRQELRDSIIKCLSEEGFDIKVEARMLKETYFNLVEKRNR